MLSLIAAVADNRVIGMGNRIPWKFSEDLKRFKELTMGHTLIMGRKTFESIGRPLPGRRTIVVSRKGIKTPYVDVASTLESALLGAQGDSEAFICGGSEIYKQALGLVDRMYLTTIHGTFAGDAYFPEIDFSQWSLVSVEPVKTDNFPYLAEFRQFHRETSPYYNPSDSYGYFSEGDPPDRNALQEHDRKALEGREKAPSTVCGTCGAAHPGEAC